MENSNMLRAKGGTQQEHACLSYMPWVLAPHQTPDNQSNKQTKQVKLVYLKIDLSRLLLLLVLAAVVVVVVVIVIFFILCISMDRMCIVSRR